MYDHKVVTNSGAPASFATQSLRMSNAVTSGCFGDQTFSKSLVNAAGETSAEGGTRPEAFVRIILRPSGHLPRRSLVLSNLDSLWWPVPTAATEPE